LGLVARSSITPKIDENEPKERMSRKQPPQNVEELPKYERQLMPTDSTTGRELPRKKDDTQQFTRTQGQNTYHIKDQISRLEDQAQNYHSRILRNREKQHEIKTKQEQMKKQIAEEKEEASRKEEEALKRQEELREQYVARHRVVPVNPNIPPQPRTSRFKPKKRDLSKKSENSEESDAELIRMLVHVLGRMKDEDENPQNASSSSSSSSDILRDIQSIVKRNTKK